ncbi:hypothetical protein, partial [Endozoicomonas atrinae]|uniref:hypothetical protein n=1 Tax=Endozoicomonas atrinae TaxID=1333660 RepID=UPI001EE7726B
FTIPLFLGDMRKPTGLTVFLGVFFDAHHNRRSPFCGNHCPSAACFPTVRNYSPDVIQKP